jgi:hypothetical protein
MAPGIALLFWLWRRDNGGLVGEASPRRSWKVQQATKSVWLMSRVLHSWSRTSTDDALHRPVGSPSCSGPYSFGLHAEETLNV